MGKYKIYNLIMSKKITYDNNEYATSKSEIIQLDNDIIHNSLTLDNEESMVDFIPMVEFIPTIFDKKED